MTDERSEGFSEFLAAKAEEVERQWFGHVADSVLSALMEGEHSAREHKNASVTMYAQRDAVMRLISNTMAGFRKDAIDATKEISANAATIAAQAAAIACAEGIHQQMTAELAAQAAEIERLTKRLEECYQHDESVCKSNTGMLRWVGELKAELAALRSQLEEQRAKTIDVLEEADDYVSCTPYNERPEESNQRNGFLKVLREHVASLKST
jgi:septal ring factor EnvC (AmiA/AmiB activator)